MNNLPALDYNKSKQKFETYTIISFNLSEKRIIEDNYKFRLPSSDIHSFLKRTSKKKPTKFIYRHVRTQLIKIKLSITYPSKLISG